MLCLLTASVMSVQAIVTSLRATVSISTAQRKLRRTMNDQTTLAEVNTHLRAIDRGWQGKGLGHALHALTLCGRRRLLHTMFRRG